MIFKLNSENIHLIQVILNAYDNSNHEYLYHMDYPFTEGTELFHLEVRVQVSDHVKISIKLMKPSVWQGWVGATSSDYTFKLKPSCDNVFSPQPYIYSIQGYIKAMLNAVLRNLLKHSCNLEKLNMVHSFEQEG